MRIHLAGVFVDDQQKALRFYTETLGFQLKHNIPLGEFAWITVVSPEDPEGTEFLLEPDNHPAVRPFVDAIVADGIPSTSFAVDDVQAEYERLVASRRATSSSPQPTSGPSSPRSSTTPAATSSKSRSKNPNPNHPKHPSRPHRS